MNRNVLVTGATGFIGTHLTKKLIEENLNVKCLVRKESPKVAIDYLSKLGCELFYGDLLDKESFINAVKNVDVVFHLAGGGKFGMKKEEYFKINVFGTKNIIESCIYGNVKKFIHISTCSVMGNIKNPPANEKEPYKSEGTLYSEAKIESEKLALSYIKKIPIIVLRLSSVYGPPLIKKNPLEIGGITPVLIIFKLVKEGRWKYIGSGENFIHWIYIDDAISGILLAEKNGIPGEVYIIAGNKAITIKESIEIISKIIGVKSPQTYIPIPFAFLGSFFFELKSKLFGGKHKISRESIRAILVNRSYDFSKARKELGYKPEVSIEEGMRKTIEWYERNKYL